MDGGKKQILLRLSTRLWQDLSAWAEDDFRSLNGQIEFLLTDALRRRRRLRAGEEEATLPPGPVDEETLEPNQPKDT